MNLVPIVFQQNKLFLNLERCHDLWYFSLGTATMCESTKRFKI